MVDVWGLKGFRGKVEVMVVLRSALIGFVVGEDWIDCFYGKNRVEWDLTFRSMGAGEWDCFCVRSIFFARVPRD